MLTSGSQETIAYMMGEWGLVDRQFNSRKTASNNLNKSKVVRIIRSWNARTMCPGLSNDLQHVNASKTFIIDSKLDRRNADTATLQETYVAIMDC